MEKNNTIKRLGIDDTDMVNAIMRHQDVYWSISDDGCTSAEEFTSEVILGLDSVYVLSTKPENVFLFMPFTHRTYWMHTCVLPGSRGKDAIDAGMAVTDWMFDEAKAAKLLGMVPDFNRAARVYAVRIGFRPFGVSSRCYLKDGIFCDLHFFEKGR